MMRSIRDLLAAVMTDAPRGEWVIQVEDEAITIFHKTETLILLHFPRRNLESVALLMKELDQSFVLKETKL